MYFVKKHNSTWIGMLILFLGLSFGTAAVRTLLVHVRTYEEEFSPPPFDPGHESDYVERYSGLLERYYDRGKTADTIAVTGRNIFQPLTGTTAAEKPFTVNDIVFEPFVFIYMGFIEKSPDEVIAQINWNDETYFVEKGEALREWTVTDIKRDSVTAVNAQGESITMPLQQRILSDKPYAIVTVPATGEARKIAAGDTVEGYKVLDITRDTVILATDSGPLTINK